MLYLFLQRLVLLSLKILVSLPISGAFIDWIKLCLDSVAPMHLVLLNRILTKKVYHLMLVVERHYLNHSMFVCWPSLCVRCPFAESMEHNPTARDEKLGIWMMLDLITIISAEPKTIHGSQLLQLHNCEYATYYKGLLNLIHVNHEKSIDVII